MLPRKIIVKKEKNTVKIPNMSEVSYRYPYRQYYVIYAPTKYQSSYSFMHEQCRRQIFANNSQ